MAEMVNAIPKTTPEILARIKELLKESKENQAEAVRLSMRLGALYIQLKEKSPGTWLAKLKRMGVSGRVASRLMKVAGTLASPDGTVSERLLQRLPADPIKLETLCGLKVPDIERLVNKHDTRHLDRQDVVELVRAAQGKTADGPKAALSPVQAIRKNWQNAIAALLARLDKIKGEEERRQLVEQLEATLDDLREALQKPSAEDAEEDADEGAEPADQAEEEPEAGEQEVQDREEEQDVGEDGGPEPAEGEDAEDEPAEATEEPPQPRKGQKPPAGRSVGRQRKPQPV